MLMMPMIPNIDRVFSYSIHFPLSFVWDRGDDCPDSLMFAVLLIPLCYGVIFAGHLESGGKMTELQVPSEDH